MFGKLGIFAVPHCCDVPAVSGLSFLNTQSMNVILNIRGGISNHQDSTTSREGREELFEDIFESKSSSIDYSDNRAQVRVIKHHYMSKFGNHISLQEVMKDYSNDVVIHEVMDNVPKTYRGHDGVRQAFRDMYYKVPHDTSHFEFEFIAVDHDHAQVVWRAVIPGKDVVIQGMESFAFDEDNHITNQSIMAISTERRTDTENL
mmetsp:Transcript_13592/g.19819  ORF Transcript_13592/g.19819 Transcript_13592/m.19819 type:complete len:203 (-) Transcript_13592:582-1190(-)